MDDEASPERPTKDHQYLGHKQKKQAIMKSSKKKTLSGVVIAIERPGKKTRQGNGLRSKPKAGKKRYRGQGR